MDKNINESGDFFGFYEYISERLNLKKLEEFIEQNIKEQPEFKKFASDAERISIDIADFISKFVPDEKSEEDKINMIMNVIGEVIGNKNLDSDTKEKFASKIYKEFESDLK